jgi:hypothetical protein
MRKKKTRRKREREREKNKYPNDGTGQCSPTGCSIAYLGLGL